MNRQNLTSPSATDTFGERIKLLIQRVGSVTEIARMCGFSEGVVRSWRDGNTDPSRARCVTLARTLGISLVWLVAGDGPLQIDPSAATADDQYSAENATAHRFHTRQRPQEPNDKGTVDVQRLNTAVRILQSELDLADSNLPLSEHADLLGQLYKILGPGGTHVDPIAMVSFNHELAERVRKERSVA